MDRMHEWITTGERPALPLYVSPFAKAASGSSPEEDDEDSDDDDGDGDGDGDDDEGDDPDADKSDEEIRTELKAVREQLKKANNSSAKRRRALREKEAELDAERKKRVAKPKAKADDEDEAPDLDALREEAKREGSKEGITRAKKAEAKAALLGAGVNPARVIKAVGLLDLDELDLDDDGLDGIDDAIEALREEWPEMFASKRKRRDSVAGSGDRDGKSAPKKTLTPSERQALALTGRSR